MNLEEIVESVLADYPGIRLRRFAFMKCGNVSLDFAARLMHQDIDHTVMCLRRRKTGTVAGSCHEFWRQTPLKEWKHYVVRVGEWYYDFTARQFDKDADLPRVLNAQELMSEWKLMTEVGSGRFILEAIRDEKTVKDW